MSTFFLNFNTWVQGVLFILIVYHTSAFFITKDKSLGVYAAYLFLVFLYLIPKTNNESSMLLANYYSSFFRRANWIIQVYYWLLYAWFSLLFLSISKKSKILSSIIKWYIKSAFVISTMICVIDLFAFDNYYFVWYFITVFMPVSLLIVFVFLKTISKFKDVLNTYFVVGVVFFVGFSLLAIIFSYFPRFFFKGFSPIDVFIFGVLIEAIALSVGLGYKFFLFREESFKLEQLKNAFENEINELKLASLHSQMNPHFIFNALNSIKLYIINNDRDRAAHYLTRFSKLIRKILEASNKNEVTLKEELETIDLYLNIENIRFKNQIEVLVSVDNTINLEQVKLPPLILQPFLENAIWHGLSSKKNDKKITIDISKYNTHFVSIKIEDNGIGRKASAKIKAEKSIKRKSVGIQLTKERLDRFVKYKKHNYTLSYRDVVSVNNEAAGTVVFLALPLV
ncbi:sensor histidine kinase [Algibacter lectus]|uniref:sensor histidine kinase n=1 Tax=Algibacter lectus TaxID=221126 RepID=UPI002493FF8A|nr:histidine kinase [Algibacter lectus]